MNVSRLSAREKALVALAATALPGIFVLLFGAVDKRAELVQKSAERERLEVALGQKPAATDAELARLTARRVALRDQIEKNKKALAEVSRAFPKDGAAALAAVSELAARLGILVRESAPFDPASDPLPRPRRRFVIVASFPALRAFIAALPGLRDGPVHLESMTVDSVALPSDIESGAEEAHVLVATLVLVL